MKVLPTLSPRRARYVRVVQLLGASASVIAGAALALSTSSGCFDCDSFCTDDIELFIKNPKNVLDTSPDATFEVCATTCSVFQVVGDQCKRISGPETAECGNHDITLNLLLAQDTAEKVSLTVRSGADAATATVLFESTITLETSEDDVCGTTCTLGEGTFTIP